MCLTLLSHPPSLHPAIKLGVAEGVLPLPRFFCQNNRYPLALRGGRVQTFAATDLEGFEPKSESESESKKLGCLLLTFNPLVWPRFLSPAALASESKDPSTAVFLDLGAAFFLARISMMDGWLSETELCV